MWNPDVTVAAICQRDNRFLIVEERSKSSGKIVLNQPSGHLEDGESIIQAVKRETLEETCCEFTPQSLVGLYRLRLDTGKTYIRYTFSGIASLPVKGLELDQDIIRTHWMSRQELAACDNLRSGLVLSCIDDYLNGVQHSLDVIREL